MDPSVNPDLLGAVRVPDASVDPFHLTTANVLDARQHGADVLTYHEVVAILTSNGRVEGVRLRNNHTGKKLRNIPHWSSMLLVYGDMTLQRWQT